MADLAAHRVLVTGRAIVALWRVVCRTYAYTLQKVTLDAATRVYTQSETI